MGEPWEPPRRGPMCCPLRRIPLDARAVERRRAAGAPALQALLQCAREAAGTREAPEAETGLFKRRRPLGWAALPRDLAPRGTGEVGPAGPRADGMIRPRAQTRRGRADGARCGTCAVARRCDRRPGEPGICRLDAPVTRPTRGDAYGLPAWMAVCAVEPPGTDRAGVGAPRLARARAERVLRAGAPAAPAADARCAAPRPMPPAATAGARLGGRCEGQGVPRRPAAAVKRTAPVGPGDTRPQKTAALVGVRATVAPQPRSPDARAARLGAPAAARARRPRDETRAEAPRAPPVRRRARLVRTTPAVRARLPAAAARRNPQPRNAVVVRRAGALGRGHLATPRGTPWQPVTVVRDLRPGGGDRWRAAHAWCAAASQAGQPGVPPQLTERRRGRVGDVLGRPATNPHQAAAAPVGARDARPSHPGLPPPSALEAGRRGPGAGWARGDRRRRVGVRCGGQAPAGGRRPAVAPRRSSGHAAVARAQAAPCP